MAGTSVPGDLIPGDAIPGSTDAGAGLTVRAGLPVGWRAARSVRAGLPVSWTAAPPFGLVVRAGLPVAWRATDNRRLRISYDVDRLLQDRLAVGYTVLQLAAIELPRLAISYIVQGPLTPLRLSYRVLPATQDTIVEDDPQRPFARAEKP